MVKTIRQFVNDLDQIIQQARNGLGQKMIKGQIASIEEYKRQVGRAEGMEETVKLAREMLGQLEASQEDDGLPEMDGGQK